MQIDPKAGSIFLAEEVVLFCALSAVLAREIHAGRLVWVAAGGLRKPRRAAIILAAHMKGGSEK